MKIAISGSQGVGKSTLMAKIEDMHIPERYVFIKEIVRTLKNQGIKINRDADYFSQCKILEEHYKNTLRYESFITDRCAVDAFVYATYDYLNGKYTFEQYKQFENIFLECIRQYNIFYFLPVEFEIEKDGVRDIDKQYQKEINDLFITIYKKYEIRYEILTGTIEERLRKFAMRSGFTSFLK